jgi:hypothetical protein
MPNNTTLISFLSPNSVGDVATGARGTSPTKLEVSLVAGAAGFSNKLDADAYYTARAVYYDSKTDEDKALAAGMELVKQRFRKYEWNPKRALAHQVKEAMKALDYQEEERTRVEEMAYRLFQLNMAKLALSELRNNENCMSCNGAGVKRYKSQTGFRICKACNGTGKKRATASYKYKALGITDRQWETWGPRYEDIYTELSMWLSEYTKRIGEQLDG